MNWALTPCVGAWQFTGGCTATRFRGFATIAIRTNHQQQHATGFVHGWMGTYVRASFDPKSLSRSKSYLLHDEDAVILLCQKPSMVDSCSCLCRLNSIAHRRLMKPAFGCFKSQLVQHGFSKLILSMLLWVLGCYTFSLLHWDQYLRRQAAEAIVECILWIAKWVMQ